MKTLLLAALALSLTAVPSARANDGYNHNCHDRNGNQLTLSQAGLGRKAIDINVDGTKVHFQTVGATDQDADLTIYVGASRDSYAIEVIFNEAAMKFGGSGPSTAQMILVTPDSKTITIQGMNCDVK